MVSDPYWATVRGPLAAYVAGFRDELLRQGQQLPRDLNCKCELMHEKVVILAQLSNDRLCFIRRRRKRAVKTTQHRREKMQMLRPNVHRKPSPKQIEFGMDNFEIAAPKRSLKFF